MGDDVKENLTEQEYLVVDIRRELNIQYRLLRKKWSAFIRKQLKKNFSTILYVTVDKVPTEFILALQKQYPDKIVKVLVPLIEVTKDLEKTSISTDYFLQNKKRSAVLYKIPSEYSHIQIYGIYTNAFSKNSDESEFYNIKYLSHFVKAARKFALKIKPDIVHSDNVPFLMGLELGGRSGYSVKFLQTVHNERMYSDLEPFWAFINLANKKEMKRVMKDKFILKNIALLFNLKKENVHKKIRACLNYLYKNYDEYRKNVELGMQTKENVILNRLNERVKKMFPNFIKKGDRAYNPMYYSLKRAGVRAFNSQPKNSKLASAAGEYKCLPKKSDKLKEYKIHHTFDKTNYREVRPLNKKFLLRELSEKRIETKFIDMNLFDDNEVNISGYLDSFYKAPLFFVPFNGYVSEQVMKTASAAILKAFELRKNIQVIYNYSKNLNSVYLKSLFEFFESQPALNGRWTAIEGNVNLGQFMSAADMVLFPSGDCLGIEKLLYTALKYGCVPIVSRKGICADIVTDIFDNMSIGCGFKNRDILDDEIKEYETGFIRALEFYTNNNASWNVLMNNAMNYNSGWDFESIEEYNSVYDDLI